MGNLERQLQLFFNKLLVMLLHATGAQSVNLQSPTPKDEAFQKAIQEYVKKLSNDDKAAFKSVASAESAQDLIERLQEMQHNNKSPISSSCISRVERVLQCIKSFMSSLSIFIQQNPEISSLVVGGVNCIMMVGTGSTCYSPEPKPYISYYDNNSNITIEQLVLGYIEFFERLTGMMERIGTHLSYLAEYSRANFQDSEKLQEVRYGSRNRYLIYHILTHNLSGTCCSIL